MMIVGLTGSIGMGKSATARMFKALGVPVHDADAAVHRLYAGDAAPLIEAAFPGTTADGRVDRARLAEAVLGDAGKLRRLEKLVHPLVHAEERGFLAAARETGARMAIIEVPLLLETVGDARVDAVIVCSAAPGIQRQRVLERPGMTADKLDAILARQMPDPEKRRRAHFVVDTGRGFAIAERQVAAIVRALAAHPGRPRPLS